MRHLRSLLIASTLMCLPLAACDKGGTTTPDDAASGDDATGDQGEAQGEAEPEADEFAGREVVDNWLAKPGDVTVCPISGKKFEVDDEAGQFSYQGYDFVFCCSGKCIEKVEADPGKFLDALVEEAGGPASDPDPNEGGAIDDA